MRKRILVIDDDAASCEVLVNTLEDAGFAVRAAFDADSGAAVAKEFLPHLVFINLLLPGTNGLKVSKTIRSISLLEKVPVVMFVSYEGELDTKYTVTIGVVDSLVKPLKKEDLLEKTFSILGRDSGDDEEREGSAGVFSAPGLQEAGTTVQGQETGDAFRSGAPELSREPQQRGKEGSGADLLRGSSSEMIAGAPESVSGTKVAVPSLGEDLFSSYRDELTKQVPEGKGRVTMAGKTGSLHLPAEDKGIALGDVEKRPVRRALLVALAVAAGAGIGVGGYLFFTAGQKQPLMERSVTQVKPQPAAEPSSAPATSRTDAPEVPAGSESQKSEAIARAEQTKVPGASAKAGGAYFVQIGYFGNEKNARALAGRMKQKGHRASVQSERTGTKVFHRVLIGGFESRGKASDQSRALLREEGIESIILVR
jgi:CheY-like chemotaxis protein